MAASSTEEHFPLRILVDEVKNRVVFAQAGKDFVDALLCFLTLPLGTIARLAGKESNMIMATIARLLGKESNMNKVSVGSLSSLYESVANLEVNHFWTKTCKEMLLQPRNSMETYCQNMKLNIDDTEKMKFFICQDWDCSRQLGGLLSTFKNQRCKCGKLMNREISPQNGITNNHEEGFIREMATFIISDDLKVMPDKFQASVVQPTDLGCEDINSIKEVTVNVTKKEIVDLLKCSLLSKTPLTDLFLRKKQFHENAQPSIVLDFNIGESITNVELGWKVKVMLRKSNRKILFALAEENFVDFLFSFLTFPLGGVEQMLNAKSCLGSIDNLYKSIVDLDGGRYLRSSDLKDMLVKPRLAYQFKVRNQILPIDEVCTSNYYCYSELDSLGRISGYLTKAQNYMMVCHRSEKVVCASLSYLEPQSSTGKTYESYVGGEGFAKSPSLYMVTDDLVITPGSSISVVSFLSKSKIPPSDLEEKVISIGQKEGLGILKASLISSSALTNGLGQFIKPTKQENIPN